MIQEFEKDLGKKDQKKRTVWVVHHCEWQGEFFKTH